MATGISDFSIKDGSKPFHIEVGVPETAKKYWELIERIVEQEKPAHITAEVFIKSGEREEKDAGDKEDKKEKKANPDKKVKNKQTKTPSST